nr:hypothetical protein [uncultured bacterium]
MTIYGLGRFDAAWGRGYTLQIALWLAVATSILVFVGATFGAIFAARVDRSLDDRYAVVAGFLTALLLGALVYLRHEFQMEGGLFGAVVGSILLPFLVVLKMSRPN